MISRFAAMHSVFSGLLMYSSYKLNGQPVRELVTTSIYYNSSPLRTFCKIIIHKYKKVVKIAQFFDAKISPI